MLKTKQATEKEKKHLTNYSSLKKEGIDRDRSIKEKKNF